MEYFDLLIETGNEYLFYDDSLPYLTKTKLIKLTYLIEYYYYKHNTKRLTDAEWVFYLYGPYIFDFDKFLSRSPFLVEEADDDSEYKILVRDEEFYARENISEYEVKQLIKNIVSEFGKQSINEILDFIYFDTEPMLNVETRGDKLDFNCIQPHYQIEKQKLEKKEIKAILANYSKRIECARAI